MNTHVINIETCNILECKRGPIGTGIEKKGNKAHGTIHVTSDNDRHIGGWERSVQQRGPVIPSIYLYGFWYVVPSPR